MLTWAWAPAQRQVADCGRTAQLIGPAPDAINRGQESCTCEQLASMCSPSKPKQLAAMPTKRGLHPGLAS